MISTTTRSRGADHSEQWRQRQRVYGTSSRRRGVVLYAVIVFGIAMAAGVAVWLGLQALAWSVS